jgi:exodeoxyribonuclease V alpha subunit
MEVDFYGNKVTFRREELSGNIIKHAYAMSIHKSQGSEFNHVIMPLSKEYSRMLYNKLIYTGVSRAKKSLLLIGDEEAFIRGVNNSYSEIRKTSLKELLLEHIR